MHPQECILGSLGVLGLFEHLAQVTQPGWIVPDLHTSSSKPLGLPLRPEEALSSALIVDVEVFFLARPTAWWRLCKSDPNPWQPTSIALHLVVLCRFLLLSFFHVPTPLTLRIWARVKWPIDLRRWPLAHSPPILSVSADYGYRYLGSPLNICTVVPSFSMTPWPHTSSGHRILGRMQCW